MRMTKKIILVTGGTRSGKSLFAEQYAQAAGRKIAYIATAQIYDNEMQARIELHRRRRPKDWKTFEAPYDAGQAITVAAQSCDTILFDCLTIYTSNLLLADAAPADKTDRYAYITGAVDQLLAGIHACNATVIFVTNEVGMGIVPENALAREYRDLAGLVNQRVAAAADEVYLVVSGIAVELKKIAAELPGGD